MTERRSPADTAAAPLEGDGPCAAIVTPGNGSATLAASRRRRPPLTLRLITILLICGAVLATAVLGVFLYVSDRGQSAAMRDVEHERLQLALYGEVRVAVMTQSADLAAYYAVRTPAYSLGFRDARARADTLIAQLREGTTPGEWSQRGGLDDLAVGHAALSGEQERVLQAMESGDISYAFAIAGNTGLEAKSLQFEESVARGFATAREELTAALANDQATQDRMFRWALGIAGVWGVFVLALALASFLAVIHPLERIRKATQAIARGDLSARIRPSGPREFVDVAMDVNAMAESLIRRADELNAYLSRNLEARTLELEGVNSALAEAERRFRSLVQNASDVICVIETDTVIRYVSPAVEQVLGQDPVDLLGTPLADAVHPDDAPHLARFMRDAAGAPPRVTAASFRLRHSDSSWRHIDVVGKDGRDDPAIRGFVLNMRDASERMTLENQLRYQAFHDPLTRLANGAAFSDRLDHALSRTARSGTKVAVVFLDLDNFKSVNDTLGHGAGDRLLIAVGARLRTCIRPQDTLARLGGDEFAIALEDLADAYDALPTAERILAALRAPFLVDASEVFVSASLGIALSRPGEMNADQLLGDADVAMYMAKSRGKGQCEIYDQSMYVPMRERLALLAELQRAVEQHEFVVYYQPLVALPTARIVGMEALVRWHHPARGLLAPAEFIALAEESGAIVPLGRWVLEQACSEARSWQLRYPSEPPLTISVNVSVKQLLQPTFVAEVRRVLEASGVEPSSLVLEITESVMMEDVGTMVQTLEDVKALGVRLAIDDFGTGYSSLSYLRTFPFDILKIDKSFVAAVGERVSEQELERAIIDLARTFKLEVVAEGIERIDQLTRLRSLGCDFGQGYYFSRPVPAAEFGELLARDRLAQQAV